MIKKLFNKNKKELQTSNCGQYSHPEIVIKISSDSELEDTAYIILNYLESMIQNGSKYKVEEQFQVGWMTCVALQLKLDTYPFSVS